MHYGIPVNSWAVRVGGEVTGRARPAAARAHRVPAEVGGVIPSVSVITATLLEERRIPGLLQVHADLAASAVAWEWVVVVDGSHDREVPAPLRADHRVRLLRTGRPVGAAAARNLGLGIARGRYVTAADDDDRLPPFSLDHRLAAVRRCRVAWAGGMLADLREGILTGWDCPMRAGAVAPGDVWRAWGCPCAPFPLGPTTLLVDAGLLREVGGWHGLPQAEDFGMVLAVTGRAPGIVLDEVVYVYCRHEAQMTTRPGFDDLEPLVRHITFERGRLVAHERAPAAVPRVRPIPHRTSARADRAAALRA